MFCIQTSLFEYDMVTSYMEGFLALKCTTITELFYVIKSYHIYTNVYYLVQWKVKIDGNIYIYSKIVLNGLVFKFQPLYGLLISIALWHQKTIWFGY